MRLIAAAKLKAGRPLPGRLFRRMYGKRGGSKASRMKSVRFLKFRLNVDTAKENAALKMMLLSEIED